MLKRVTNILFSMQLMGILIIIFAVAIGVATFIENDFGTTAARTLVYDARWFEVLLILLALNMTGSFFKFRVLKKSKWAIIIFHFSFIIILIGAGITRYWGYEGSMHIRENETVNSIRTYESFIHLTHNQQTVSKQVAFAEGVKNKFHASIHDIDVKLLEFIPNANESLIEIPGGETILTFGIISGDQRQMSYVKKNSSRFVNDIQFAFDDDPDARIVFSHRNDTTFITSKDTITIIDMAANQRAVLPDQPTIFENGKLYRIGNNLQLSMGQLFLQAQINFSVADTPERRYADVVKLEVSDAQNSKEVIIRGASGVMGQPSVVNLGAKSIQIAYGAKTITLPFSLKLNDFILDRYPGSNSPSSFESEVTLIDNEKNIHENRRIYMNNVLEHRGYRFYQSSYDQDEKGTILSVNHDGLGTIVTYIGYFLLTLGMSMSIFARSSRFQMVSKKIREVQKTASVILVLAMFAIPSFTFAQNNTLKAIDYNHAKEFGGLLVQDKQGRIEPMNTLASEVIRKITRKSTFNGLHSDQVFLGMILEPEKWKRVPMIRISHPEIQAMTNNTGKYAAFTDFVQESQGAYLLRNAVESAYAKKPAERNKFDKEVIKVDERVNIFYMATMGQYLKLFPKPGDSQHTWYTPFSHNLEISGDDSLFVANIFSLYGNAVVQGIQSDNYTNAASYLEGIKKFQLKYGSEIIPAQGKIKAELWYNKANIFLRLGSIYGLIGFVLLILVFIRILSKYHLKWPVRIFSILVYAAFALHTFGLGLRWYLSGHAPWSDGYESLIYIGFATVLAGVVFSVRSPLTLAATSILASIILMVAHLSWMDPEITNLVPVLKSYWLTIHVSIITASYGFFALGALLGFLNLMLNLFKSGSNILKIDERIEELSYINEMSLTIGLYMLTIGTFLGGVWANESWGRYWGWDPKETWALFSILAYAFILHMRMIPGLRSRFAFNLFALVGFGSIIMTYFGVNYYLSGLHSYAKGDPMPIPAFVYYSVAIIIVVGIFSYISDRKYRSVTGE